MQRGLSTEQRLAGVEQQRRQLEADTARQSAIRTARMRRLMARLALDAGEPLIATLLAGGERGRKVHALLDELVEEPQARARVGLPLRVAAA
jgi:hypothetical protein